MNEPTPADEGWQALLAPLMQPGRIEPDFVIGPPMTMGETLKVVEANRRVNSADWFLVRDLPRKTHTSALWGIDLRKIDRPWMLHVVTDRVHSTRILEPTVTAEDLAVALMAIFPADGFTVAPVAPKVFAISFCGPLVDTAIAGKPHLSMVPEERGVWVQWQGGLIHQPA